MKIEVYLEDINNPISMECRGNTLYIGPSTPVVPKAADHVPKQPWGAVKRRLWNQHQAHRETVGKPD